MSSESQITQREKAVEELIYLTAHQLRNPLTIALGWVSLLEDDLPKEAQKKIVFDIKKSIDRLNRIVGSFLTVARIESGQTQLIMSRCDISFIVEEATEDYLATAEQKNIRLNLSMHQTAAPVLACDREKILQAVSNLIDNAIKYSPRNSQVGIRLFSDQRDVHVQITDSGIGFDPVERKMLFKKHYRTPHAKNHDRRGLGLGLYFVKKVAEAHSGSIDCTSAGVNKGSTFFLTLPRT